jgi:hypothetical protein
MIPNLLSRLNKVVWQDTLTSLDFKRGRVEGRFGASLRPVQLTKPTFPMRIMRNVSATVALLLFELFYIAVLRPCTVLYLYSLSYATLYLLRFSCCIHALCD